MIDQPQKTPELALPFPITRAFRRQAQAYAAQYFTQDTHEIYLNTLSVFVANAYLQLLGFSTNLASPDRWNAACRLWGDASELELVGLGNLECRSISIGQTVVTISPEAWDDRIGYLVIKIATSEKVAELVGFLPASSLEIPEAEIVTADLQSINEMIDYLTDLEDFSFSKEFTDHKITYLRQWLDNIYEADWEPAARDLSRTDGEKKISLADQVFVLKLTVSQYSDELIGVQVSVRAAGGFLPRGLKVCVPDEDKIHTETVSEQADLVIIPLEFSCGEEFWVELQMGSCSAKEYFIG